MDDKNNGIDTNDIKNKEEKNDENSYVGYGVAFGLIGGAAFSSIAGLLFEFPLIWAYGPGFGMMIGIVIGAVMDANKNKDS